MNKKWDFLSEMTEIDNRFIVEAAKPWTCSERNSQQMLMKIAACFAILVALVISSMIVSPKARVMAENIGVKIGEFLGNREDVTSYAQIFNTTKTVADIDVTLENVMLDEDTLYALVDMKDKRSDAQNGQKNVNFTLGDLCINGKSIGDIADNQDTGKHTGIGEKGTESLIEYTLEGYTFPEKVEELKLPLKLFKYKNKEDAMDIEVLGEVEFTFSASRKELEASTKRVEPDIEVSLKNDTKVKVQKVSINEVASRIFVECDKEFWGESEVYLKGKDSKGNIVCYGGNLRYNEKKGGVYFYCKSEGFTPEDEQEFAKENSSYGRPLPDMKADSMELQFYYLDPVKLEEDKDSSDGWWYPTDRMYPVGKKFTISLK